MKHRCASVRMMSCSTSPIEMLYLSDLKTPELRPPSKPADPPDPSSLTSSLKLLTKVTLLVVVDPSSFNTTTSPKNPNLSPTWSVMLSLVKPSQPLNPIIPLLRLQSSLNMLSSKSSLERPSPPSHIAMLLYLSSVLILVRFKTIISRSLSEMSGGQKTLIPLSSCQKLLGLAHHTLESLIVAGLYLNFSDPVIESGLVFTSLNLFIDAFGDDEIDGNPHIYKEYIIGPKTRTLKPLSTVESKFSGFSNPAISADWHRSELLHLYAISRTILFCSIDVLYIVDVRSRWKPYLLGWSWAHRTSYPLSQPHSVPKPKTLVHKKRVLLSSMLTVFVVQAIDDLEKVRDLKKAASKFAFQQILVSQNLVDGDLSSRKLENGRVLDEASDKGLRISNGCLVTLAFGSQTITNEDANMFWNLFDSIKLETVLSSILVIVVFQFNRFGYEQFLRFRSVIA